MPHRLFREARDLADDIRRVFDELEKRQTTRTSVSGECVPPLDVLETSETIEITVDLPGVPVDAIRILIKGGLVLVAGEKAPLTCASADASFHLVEQGFGRFARVVRLTGAVDAARATATLQTGELRLVIPKIDERRGREIPIAIQPFDATS